MKTWRKGNPLGLLVAMQAGTILWEIVQGFLKKWKTELSYNLVILLLAIYLKKMKTLIGNDTCTPMLIPALFTIAKMRKQPECPSTDEWIKKWYIWILFSHKRERNLAIHDNMDESRGHDVKGNKSDRERELPYDFTLCLKFKTTKNRNRILRIEN